MTTTIPEPDPIPDAGWPLAEEFDRVARTPGLKPDAGLLTAVVMWLSEEIMTALLGSHEELCVAEEVPEAENYAEHLAALADLLEPDGRRAVLAAVDVAAAELYERTGNPDEALRRAQRCADDVDELLPVLRGDREWVLACLAEGAGHRADAHDHAARARDHFADDERWVEAARAAEAAAGTHERITPEAVADWHRAAELYVVAGEPDEARDCAEQCCFEIAKTWGRVTSGDEVDVSRACTAAAALAREHGLVAAVVRVDMLAAALLIDSGTPFAEVAARLAESRRALETLDRSPDEHRLDDARLDLFLGVACVAHTRWADAERLLSAALPTLRALGTADEVAGCEDALRGMLSATSNGSLGDAATSDAGRLFLEAMRRVQEGRLDDALARLDEAQHAATTEGDPHQAVVLEAVAAALRLATGDRAAARAALVRIEAHLATADDRIPRSRRIMLTAVAGLLRAEPAASDGRIDDLDAAYAATEADLIALGAGPGAARVAVGRARTLLDAGSPRDALDVGLPATLALDALRCTLPDAQRRSLWSVQVAEGFDTAFRAAAACGDTRVLAELLEVGRGNAVPLPRAPDDRTDAVSALSAALTPEAGPGSTALRPGPATIVGGEERTALGLPAFVRTPWDTVALGSALEAARRYLDPVRAPLTVDWRVHEPRPAQAEVS